jgi:hypothetical protein
MIFLLYALLARLIHPSQVLFNAFHALPDPPDFELNTSHGIPDFVFKFVSVHRIIPAGLWRA